MTNRRAQQRITPPYGCRTMPKGALYHEDQRHNVPFKGSSPSPPLPPCVNCAGGHKAHRAMSQQIGEKFIGEISVPEGKTCSRDAAATPYLHTVTSQTRTQLFLTLLCFPQPLLHTRLQPVPSTWIAYVHDHCHIYKCRTRDNILFAL